MIPRQPPGSLRAFGRALALRCPRCGSGGLFSRWMTMVDDCPGCGLHFERSPGYWLGSMAINLAVAMGTFLVFFVGIMVVTWPDVSWGWLSVIVIAVSALTPVVAHPHSRLVWVALERHFRLRSQPDD